MDPDLVRQQHEEELRQRQAATATPLPAEAAISAVAPENVIARRAATLTYSAPVTAASVEPVSLMTSRPSDLAAQSQVAAQSQLTPPTEGAAPNDVAEQAEIPAPDEMAMTAEVAANDMAPTAGLAEPVNLVEAPPPPRLEARAATPLPEHFAPKHPPSEAGTLPQRRRATLAGSALATLASVIGGILGALVPLAATGSIEAPLALIAMIIVAFAAALASGATIAGAFSGENGEGAAKAVLPGAAIACGLIIAALLGVFPVADAATSLAMAAAAGLATWPLNHALLQSAVMSRL